MKYIFSLGLLLVSGLFGMESKQWPVTLICANNEELELSQKHCDVLTSQSEKFKQRIAQGCKQCNFPMITKKSVEDIIFLCTLMSDNQDRLDHVHLELKTLESRTLAEIINFADLLDFSDLSKETKKCYIAKNHLEHIIPLIGYKSSYSFECCDQSIDISWLQMATVCQTCKTISNLLHVPDTATMQPIPLAIEKDHFLLLVNLLHQANPPSALYNATYQELCSIIKAASYLACESMLHLAIQLHTPALMASDATTLFEFIYQLPYDLQCSMATIMLSNMPELKPTITRKLQIPHIKIITDHANRFQRFFTGEHKRICLAVSNGGDKIASGCNTTIKINDLRSGACIATLCGNSDRITSVAFIANDTQLVSGSWNNTIKIWDIQTGQCLQTLLGHAGGTINTIKVIEDSNLIVSGSTDGSISIWDITTGTQQILQGHHDGGVLALSIDKESNTLVSGSYDKTIKVWSLESGLCMQTFSEHEKISAVLSYNDTIISASKKDGTIKFWDKESGRCYRIIQAHDHIYTLAKSADNKFLISGAHDNSIKIWDVASGKRLNKINHDAGPITSVVINHDGTKIISSAWNGTINVWDITRLKQCYDFFCTKISPEKVIVLHSWLQAVKHKKEPSFNRECWAIAHSLPLCLQNIIIPNSLANTARKLWYNYLQ